MNRWPADNEAALMAFYGTPGAVVESQLVPVIPPFRMVYEGQPIKAIKFHRKAAPALMAALTEIWEAYGKDQMKIDAVRASVYDGAYNPRKIAGSNRWSNHAFGAAIDIDGAHNGFNTGHGTMPKIVVDAFKRQGARWGGDYRGRTDPMHFEFCDGGEIGSAPAPKPPAQPSPSVQTTGDNMNPLTIIGLLPTILRLVDLVRGGVSTGLSFKSLTDLITNSEVMDIFKTLGATVFPAVKPEFQAVAAVAATYSPDYVKKVQNMTNQLLKPSPNLDVDGHYGPLTRAAVEKAQKQLGLEVTDGWAGDKTLAAMQTALAKVEAVMPTPVVEIPKV